jgi:hypothetical protein
MGRNSVEATKASLMRAVRARRAALLVRRVGLLPAALLVRLAGFVPVLAGVFVFCFGFGDGLGDALCVLAEAEPAGVCPPSDRAATGSTIISRESRTARQREVRRGTKVGEDATLISSL